MTRAPIAETIDVEAFLISLSRTHVVIAKDEGDEEEISIPRSDVKITHVIHDIATLRMKEDTAITYGLV